MTMLRYAKILCNNLDRGKLLLMQSKKLEIIEINAKLIWPIHFLCVSWVFKLG